MKLKNLLITTKLLLILGLFATAFLTSGGIVFWSWRQIDRTNQYLAHNYYPVMNACTNVLLDLAAARTEIYRYLGHYESSPSRVAESLDRARERLGWMAQQAQRPDIKAAISQLLALVQQYQKELAHLVRVQEQSPGMQASQLSNRLLELEGSALQVTNNLITELGTQVQADTLSTSTLFSRYLWQAGLVAALYCGLGLGLIFIISRDLRQGIGFVLSGLQVFVREHREPFPVTERNDELGHIAAEFQQMVRDLLSVEQALQDSEARYQAIVEGFDGLICVCSPDYRIEFMNRKFIERTGYDAAGEPCYQVLHGRDAVCPGCPQEWVLQGESVSWEAQSPKDNRWYYVVNAPIFQPDGRFSKLVMLQDITERHEAEAALKESEARYRRERALLRSLINSIPDIIFFKNQDSVYLGCNPAFEAFAGRTQNELIGLTDFDFLPLEEAEFYRRKDLEMMAGGSPRHNEEWIQYPDGRRVLLDMLKTPYYGPDGELLGVVGVGRDITSYRQTEDHLREALGRLQALMENLPQGLLFEDEGRLIRYANPGFCRMFGLPGPEVLIGVDCAAAAQQTKGLLADPEGFMVGIEDRLAARQVVLAEELVLTDGSVFERDYIPVPMDHQKGGSFWIYRDITDRKRTEMALEKRLLALTRPLGDQTSIAFEELFNLEEIQRIQDLFARAAGVAAIITHPDGTPITRPSNFCRLCSDVIRQTPQGLINCYCSDAMIGRYHPDGPIVQPCLSGGLWDAGTSITVGGRHLANWLIGQVRNDAQDEEQMLTYARAIGADVEEFRQALREVPVMSREQFEAVAQALFALANQLSNMAYQNVQQARFITERQQAEEARRLNEARLETLVQLAQMQGTSFQKTADFALEEGVRLTQSQVGYLCFMNEAETVLTLHAWSKNAVVQCAMIDNPTIYQLETTGLWGEAVRQRRPIITNDYAATNPYKKGYPEGHIHLHRHMNVPVLEGGRVVAVAGVGNKEEPYDDSDVLQLTLLMDGMWKLLQQQRLQETLRRGKEEWEATFDAVSDLVAIIDREYRFVRVNRAMADRLGVHPRDLIGRLYHEVVHHTETLPETCPMTQLFQDGREHQVEVQEPALGGDFLITVSPLYDREGKLVHGVHVAHDVTERKHLEAERLRLAKLEAVGVLAGGIAHDFNNIFMGILGNISLAGLAHNIAEVQERLVEAEAACGQAQSLAQQLLTFAKGGVPIKKPTSLKEIVQEAAKLSLSGSQSLVEFSWPEELWTVEVDQGQMHQAFSNLFINADQAMPTGGIIQVRADNLEVTDDAQLLLSPGKYVAVTLADQGIGISPQHLERIFDPYFTTKQRGSGLGLAVVYNIVMQHGGRITVDSQMGQGASFHLYLPTTEDWVIGEKLLAAELLTGQGRILVMDDDAGVRDVVRNMLKKLGYEPAFAQEGHEALEIYQQAQTRSEPFAGVILDLTIPGGMGGKEAMQHLLALDPQVKAVVSSGYAGDAILADYQAYGFRGVIVKPYRIQELGRVLREVIDG